MIQTATTEKITMLTSESGKALRKKYNGTIKTETLITLKTVLWKYRFKENPVSFNINRIPVKMETRLAARKIIFIVYGSKPKEKNI